MHIASRRRTVAIAAHSLLATCLVIVVSSPARTSAAGSCAELRAWASSYATAPPTLDDLAPFTRAQRVAVFNAVSPEVRAELWREHLRRFATRDDLNDTQRAFILQARADLSAATYTDRDPALRRADSRKFWSTAAPLFPSKEHQRAWFELGESTTSGASYALAASTKPPALAAANLLQYPMCHCNPDDGWLVCLSGICGGGTCWSDWACGPEGQDECIGLCVP